MKQLGLIITGVFLSVLAFISCNNNEDISQGMNGRINVHLTDAPYPIGLIKSTKVTISKVEIRQHLESDMGEDKDSFIVISEDEMVIDLLELSNGITEKIASADLEAGTYDMIRLHVDDAKIELNDGSEFTLKVPSGSSSGLKIKIHPAIQLNEGETSDVLLDFDVSRSFVVKGKIGHHINGFNFKPVVRGVYLGAAGRIEGNVSDTTGTPLENATVKLWNTTNNSGIDEDENEDGDEDDYNVQTSTFTGADGNYKLIGLPAGIYMVICELEGFVSDTIKDVTVTVGLSTTVNFKLVGE